MMTREEFHNGLRILTNIDFDELVEAKVIEGDDEVEWTVFRKNPWKWAVIADDDQFSALWTLMVKRGAVKVTAS